MGATRKTQRECCNYCMWFGPVNQDGTMRKHRPAREGTVSGERKIQDFTKPHCTGSHKPYARFGCDTEETTTVNDQQPAIARTAAHLPEGTRVTSPEGRTGTVNGYDVGHVTNTEHVNYGRKYIGVTWDPTESIPWGERSRPFVDELTIIAAQSLAESEPAPRFIVRQNGNAGQGGYFIVHDRTTHLWVSTKSSRSGAQHIADCLNDGTMVLNSLGTAVAAQEPFIETDADAA